MPWDLGNLNPTSRFIWNENADEEKKEWIEIRVASGEDISEFFKKVGVKEKRELVKDKETRQMQYVRDFDPTEDQRKKFDETLWDFTIVSWKLITPNLKEIECTKENKILMMRKSPQFNQWYSECLEELKQTMKDYREVSIKN